MAKPKTQEDPVPEETADTVPAAVVTAKAVDEMIPKSKLDDALERIKQYEKTVEALSHAAQGGNTRQQVNAAGNQMLDQLEAVIENVSRQLGGADKAEVGQWVRFLNVVLGELSRPYVNALAGLADKFDHLDARVEISDFKDYTEEIEKEREAKASRGEYLSRKEAYNLVRSRHIPDLLERERKKLIEEQTKQAADSQAGSVAGSDLGTTQKAGPTPTKEPSKYTKEEFAKLPLEEKESALENVSF